MSQLTTFWSLNHNVYISISCLHLCLQVDTMLETSKPINLFDLVNCLSHTYIFPCNAGEVCYGNHLDNLLNFHLPPFPTNKWDTLLHLHVHGVTLPDCLYMVSMVVYSSVPWLETFSVHSFLFVNVTSP